MGKGSEIDVVYPVGDPIFIHVYTSQGKNLYRAVEPEIPEEVLRKKKAILDLMLEEAPAEGTHGSVAEFRKLIDAMIERLTITPEEKARMGFIERLRSRRIVIEKDDLEKLSYIIKRDVVEHGIIEPVIRDPYIEDIHAVGLRNIHVVHKIFGMLRTNLAFPDKKTLDAFLRSMSERIGAPVSDARPIVDAALPDGSRINIVYSQDVSKEGSSFTIRKFAEKPPTIVQLVRWGTISPEIAAYLWLCLENGMSIFMSGETASGKTTTLNSMLSFIPFNRKIFTTEDTPEVIVPQPVWQRLITRSTGPPDSRVELFDLLKAALRSRPDYIVVGEIRGKEGAVAFQAIQTGHAVLSTFHASSIQKMIQRFTGEPINVPIRFMDNLNVALFQEIVYDEGRIKRRVSSVEEILRYSETRGGVLTRAIFSWDPVTDTHYFRGLYNSYILENKIASRLGYEDTKDIYDELFFRAKIIRGMADRGIVGYDEVNALFKEYSERGPSVFPFEVRR